MSKLHSKKGYEEYLKSEQWQIKRKEIAQRENYTCQSCGKIVKRGYNIHHLTYKRVGKERSSDLVFLCRNCHKAIHDKKNNQKAKKKEFKTKSYLPIVEDITNCINSNFEIIHQKVKEKVQTLHKCTFNLKNNKKIVIKLCDGKIVSIISSNKDEKEIKNLIKNYISLDK